mgnify:CR=1 FL=1
MAKKTPKTQTSTIETTNTVETKDVNTDVQKAAVNVDSKNESSKAKKAAKKSANAEKKPNIFKRMGKGIKGIISELKKVTWPKGKEVGKNTAVVLTVVVLFFVILFAIDYVLGGIFNVLITDDSQWAFIFIK